MRDVSQPEIVMGISQQNRSNFSARRSLLPWGRGKSRNFGTEAPKGALKATAVGLLIHGSSSVHRFIRVAFFCPKSNGWSPGSLWKKAKIQGLKLAAQSWMTTSALKDPGTPRAIGARVLRCLSVYVCLWLVIRYYKLWCFEMFWMLKWLDINYLKWPASQPWGLGLDTACRRHFAMDFWTSTTSFVNRYLDSLMTILTYLSRLIHIVLERKNPRVQSEIFSLASRNKRNVCQIWVPRGTWQSLTRPFSFQPCCTAVLMKPCSILLYFCILLLFMRFHEKCPLQWDLSGQSICRSCAFRLKQKKLQTFNIDKSK